MKTTSTGGCVTVRVSSDFVKVSRLVLKAFMTVVTSPQIASTFDFTPYTDALLLSKLSRSSSLSIPMAEREGIKNYIYELRRSL